MTELEKIRIAAVVLSVPLGAYAIGADIGILGMICGALWYDGILTIYHKVKKSK